MQSQQLANLPFLEFGQKVIFSNAIKLEHMMSKRLHLPIEHIDRLLPLQVSNGASFTFVIDVDPIQFGPIIDSMKKAVDNNQIKRDIAKIFKIHHRHCQFIKQSLSIIQIANSRSKNNVELLDRSSVDSLSDFENEGSNFIKHTYYDAEGINLITTVYGAANAASLLELATSNTFRQVPSKSPIVTPIPRSDS